MVPQRRTLALIDLGASALSDEPVAPDSTVSFRLRGPVSRRAGVSEMPYVPMIVAGLLVKPDHVASP